MASLSELSIDELKELREQVVARTAPTTPKSSSKNLSEMSLDELRELRGSMTTPVATDRSFLGDIPAAIGAGAIDAVEQYSRALRAFDPKGGLDIAENLGTKGVEFAKSFQKSHPEMLTAPEGTIRGSVYGGVRTMIPSAAAGAPGAILGSVAPGAGTIAGFVGFGGLIFAAAEADRFYEEATKQGIPPDEAFIESVKAGAWEGSLEAANNLLDVLLLKMGKPLTSPLKSTLKDIFKPGVKSAAKQFAKTTAKVIPAEVTTEMAQEYGGAARRQKLGMETPEPWTAAKEVIGSTVVSSVLFGLGGSGMNAAQRHSVRRAFIDPNKPVSQRIKAVDMVANHLLSQGREDLAQNWVSYAGGAVDRGEAIDLNYDVSVAPEVAPEVAVAAAPEAEAAPVTAPVDPVTAPVTTSVAPITTPAAQVGPVTAPIAPEAVQVQQGEAAPQTAGIPPTNDDIQIRRGADKKFEAFYKGTKNKVFDKKFDSVQNVRDYLTMQRAREGVAQTPIPTPQPPAGIEHPKIRPDEKINAITLDEAGKLIAKGDTEVIHSIQEGVQAKGSLAMQDAIRNEEMKVIQQAHKGPEREAVRQHIQEIEPEINEALKGENKLPLEGNVFTAYKGNNVKVMIFKNPTGDDTNYMVNRFREEYPNAPKGSVRIRHTIDTEGNKYSWMAGDTDHEVVESALARHGVKANQNNPERIPKIEPEIDKALKSPAPTPIIQAPKTGQPFEFSYSRNKEKAPYMGSRFGQDVEPAGQYVIQNDDPYLKDMFPDKYEMGIKKFNNPLVVDSEGWKQKLSKQYNAKKLTLSTKLRNEGYDGIITIDKNGETGEIVDLSAIPIVKKKQKALSPPAPTPAPKSFDPETDTIADMVRKEGGISSTKEALKGEVEGRFSIKEGYGLINNKTGKTLDMWVERSKEEGFLNEDATVRDFLDMLRRDVDAKKFKTKDRVWSPKKQGYVEEISRDQQARLLKEQRTTKEISAFDLQEGDTLRQHGEKFKVVDIKEDGTVTLKDGEVVTVDPDETIKYDRGTLKKGEPPAVTAPPDFVKTDIPGEEQAIWRGEGFDAKFPAGKKITPEEMKRKPKPKIEGQEDIFTPTPKETEKQEGLFGVEEEKAGYEAYNITQNDDGSITINDTESIPMPKWSKINTAMRRLGYDWRGADDTKRIVSGMKTLYGEQAEAIKKALDIGKSDIDLNRESIIRKATKMLGITTDLREAGYILPNGSFLDLSGKRDGGPRGTRSMDHREITEFMPHSGSSGMLEFIDLGIIRMDANSGMVSMTQKPTAQQRRQLAKLIMLKQGEVIIDMWDRLGEYDERSDYYRSPHRKIETIYNIGDSAHKILSDIEQFYKGEEGVVTVSEKSADYTAPIFFSQMQRILESKLPNKGPASAFREMIKMWANKGEFKQEEHKWSGINEWLAEQKGSVSKQEVLEWLKGNEVRVEEVMKGDNRSSMLSNWGKIKGQLVSKGISEDMADNIYRSNIESGDTYYTEKAIKLGVSEEDVKQLRDSVKLWNKNDSPTKFSQYVTPGGENYRELLLTLLEKNTYDDIQKQLGDFDKYPAGSTERLALRQKQSLAGDSFKSPHWDESNILAHVRFNERSDADGNRVLFIEEIQSDWMAEGRRKGFGGKPEFPYDALDVVSDAAGLKDGLWRVVRKQDNRPFFTTGHETKEAALADWYKWPSTRGKEGVPNAPLLKNWQELVLKRILRYAAENGFDKISWTTGAMQQERYDLSKQLKEIAYAKVDDHYDIEGILVDGKRHSFGSFKKEDLPNVVGKDVALRMTNSEGRYSSARIVGGAKGAYVLSGLDLKVGGKWAENLYDQMVPQFLNKYGKKWGAKVEEVKFEGERSEAGLPLLPMTTQSLPITPSMKQSVLYEGQQLFEKRTGYGKIGNEKAYENAKKELERQGQQGLSFTRGVVVPRPVGDTGGIKTLGVAIRRDLINKGYVDLKGHSASTPEEVATLSQIFRSPQFETFRIIYTQQGKVVGHEGVSSHMPGSSYPFLRGNVSKHVFAVLNRAQRLKADSFYFLHNHPSGDPDPSPDDVDMTARLVLRLQKLSQKSGVKIPQFGGHVVINSGKYAVLDIGRTKSDPAGITGDIDRYDVIKNIYDLPGEFTEQLLTAEKVHAYLAKEISNQKDIVAIGQALKQPDYFVTILYRGSKGGVRAIESMPMNQFKSKDAPGILRNRARSYGARDVFSFYDGKDNGNYDWKATNYVRDGILTDAVYGERSVLPFRPTPDASKWMGKRADETAVRVAEEAAKYGKQGFTPKQIIDRLFRLPFSRKLDADGRFTPGVAAYNWLSDVITKKKSGNETIDHFAEFVRKGLVDKYGLPENYQQYRHLKMLEQNAISAEGLDYYHEIHKAISDEGQRKTIYRILTENVEPGAWESLTEPVRNAIIRYGEEMVDADMLSRETFERNRGTWLHRSYKKHEAEKPAVQRAIKKIRFIGKELKHRGLKKIVLPNEVEKWVNGDKDGNTWKQIGTVDRSYYEGKVLIKKGAAIIWRDWTKDERLRMGEIEDPAYAIAVSFDLVAKDLSTGKLYKRIAEDPLLSADEDPGAWVHFGKEKISNSSTHKWGALADKWVHPEVARDLLLTEKYSMPSTWRWLLTQWKLNKTARNPVVHTNNIFSNFFLQDMSDVAMSEFVSGIKSIRDGDTYYDEAKKAGVFGYNLIQTEIKQHYNPAMTKLIYEGDILKTAVEIAKHPLRTIGALDKKFIGLYSKEDDVFRMALYKKMRLQGKSIEESAAEARRQFIDYDISAPWIQWGRNTIFPFISWPYRMVSRIAELVLTRPWKVVKYFTLFAGIEALSEFLLGVDSDEERKLLPEEQRGRTWVGVHKQVRTPPGFFDISRKLPGADIVGLSDKSAIPLPNMAVPGGPIISGLALMLNRDPFTGKNIREKEIPIPRQAELVTLWIYRQLGPNAPWVPASYSWDKIVNAYKGVTDELGRPLDPATAIPSTLGIKVSRFDPQLQLLRVQRDVKIDIAEANRRLWSDRYRAKKGEMSKSEYAKRRAEQEAIIKKHQDKLKEAHATALKLQRNPAYQK